MYKSVYITIFLIFILLNFCTRKFSNKAFMAVGFFLPQYSMMASKIIAAKNSAHDDKMCEVSFPKDYPKLGMRLGMVS